MGILFGGAAAQDADYRARWSAHAETSDERELVWAVLGDSAAVGVGAETWEDTYVAQVADRVAKETGRPVRVVNLAVSGAKAQHVLETQVPRLEELLAGGTRMDAVTCVVGGNDVTWTLPFRVKNFAEPLEEIATRLPAGSTLGLVPSFRIWPFEQRVRAANVAAREVAARHGLGVADVYTATLRRGLRHQLAHLARDRFHPNGRGYFDWASAVCPEVLRQVREAR
ncbi:SGNH/GDSL hydrolase family protein [Micrococcus sp. FDAARGOS_333]|uniref:SGNH/GDSL hydrolase family protein n=1 Tax=Micrococcus sp. FDAARGOS_333 TaxID=1930558 RepID=UPI000B4E3CB5|nr:SGNH/GDSL hydrolase family protein [Micrococcus sp. FDAARGOS_333]PNL16814.1 SGNH/GDSL hydrolase family protein [Micrococcus sp. FDAARGOS_333]